jgi:hypothetical protein
MSTTGDEQLEPPSDQGDQAPARPRSTGNAFTGEGYPGKTSAADLVRQESRAGETQRNRARSLTQPPGRQYTKPLT